MDACNTSQPKLFLSAEKNNFLGRKIKSIFFTTFPEKGKG